MPGIGIKKIVLAAAAAGGLVPKGHAVVHAKDIRRALAQLEPPTAAAAAAAAAASLDASTVLDLTVGDGGSLASSDQDLDPPVERTRNPRVRQSVLASH